MTFREFMEEVERRLGELTAAQLRGIIAARAAATPPRERRAFLCALEPPGGAPARAVSEPEEDRLLADIEAIVDELEERMEHTEDWYEWDEEDSLGPYEDFVGPLTRLFCRAAALFDSGQREPARQAYGELFRAFDLEDEFGRGVEAADLPEVDMGEAVARFLRAVYDTEPPADRPVRLFSAMSSGIPVGSKRPSLRDLLEISRQPLPEEERFMGDWIAFLRKQPGREADRWLREAVGLAQGTKGLEELARSEGQVRPRAYVDWLSALAEDGRDGEVLAGAHDALQALPEGLPVRAAIADLLRRAAAELGDGEAVDRAVWEAFLAVPVLPRLVSLIERGTTPADRVALARAAASHLETYLGRDEPEGLLEQGWEGELDGPRRPDRCTLAHAHLLAENWEKARELATGSQKHASYTADSWSLIVSGLLVFLSNQSSEGELPANIASLWRSALEEGSGISPWMWDAEERKAFHARIGRCYADLFAHVEMAPEDQERILAWCLGEIRSQVEGIVGQQHRRRYSQAATLTAAGAEALAARGEQRKSARWLEEVRERFPRHRAFQAELSRAEARTKSRGDTRFSRSAR